MKRLVLAALVPAALWAETTPLMTHTELSYVQTGGNTDTRAFALKSQVDKQVELDKYVAKANAIYSKSDGEETANKYRLEGRWERTLDERSFAFVSGDYTQDKFSGYDYRSNVGPGLGYKVLNLEDHALDALGSAQYSSAKATETGETEDYVSAKLAGDYRWKISGNSTFRQYADYQSSLDDSDNYFITSETSLAVKMNGNLSLGVSYKIEYQNLTPGEAEHTDTTFMTSLIIDY